MSRLQLQPWTANVLMLQRYNTYFLELILLKFQRFYFALVTFGFNKNVFFFGQCNHNVFDGSFRTQLWFCSIFKFFFIHVLD